MSETAFKLTTVKDCFDYSYTHYVAQKNMQLLVITPTNVNRFSNLFQWLQKTMYSFFPLYLKCVATLTCKTSNYSIYANFSTSFASQSSELILAAMRPSTVA